MFDKSGLIPQVLTSAETFQNMNPLGMAIALGLISLAFAVFFRMHRAIKEMNKTGNQNGTNNRFIRDEIEVIHGRIDKTQSKVDKTNDKLDKVIDGVSDLKENVAFIRGKLSEDK